MNLPQDSLDNLSALQTSKYRQLQAQIKQLFTAALQKLQSSETREIGISELRKLVQAYREPQHLRNFIAILKTLKPSANSPSREHQILVISILASIFKQELLDPVDKPPSLTKTCFRLVQILHNYFVDHSPTVQQACARALIDLTNYCLVSQNVNTIFQIIYSPLLSILKSGVDKGSQSTAAACLNQLINYSKRVNNQEILEKLSPEILIVILKINCEYHQLFHAVYTMIQLLGLAFLESKVVAFLAKILSVINGTRDSSNISNLNSYMCKVNVCKIIEQIGYIMPIKQKEKLIDLNIPEALQQAARHRIMQVQLAASTALKAWRGEIEESPRAKGLASLEAKRNSKKLQRSKSKEDREKLESQLTYMKEDLQKLVKGGWGANNRAKNYIKRGSGIGGGYHGKMDGSPQSKSNSKSHKQHFEQLREYIKKGAVQNKKLDKFANAEIKQANNSPQRQSQSPKSNPPLRKKSADDEVKLDIDEGDQAFPHYSQVGYEEDEGDNMVQIQANNKNTKTSSNKSAKENNIFRQMGMNRHEIDDLVANEKELMRQGKQMNIKFYTKNSGDEKKGSRPNSKYSQSDNDSLNNQQKNQPTKPQNPKPQNPKQLYKILLKQNEVVSQPKKQPKKESPLIQKDNFLRLSQQQIGQLVEQYNLSQISDNLNSLLNQSDFLMMESSKIPNIDANIIQANKGKSQMQAIKEIVADKRNRKSIIDKFFKKQENQKQPPKLNNFQKQNYEQQKPKVQQLMPAVHNNNSLNFTQSLESKNRSDFKKERDTSIQFTLNPKEKFNSIKQSHFNDRQIEQEIDMSQYVESIPKMDFHYPPQAQAKTLPQPQSQVNKRSVVVESKKEPFEKDERDYQRLIKNPPPKLAPSVSQKDRRISQNSAYQRSQTEKAQQQQEEQEDIKQEWLKIINLLEAGQINNAYEQALLLDDPIYLLRLMLMTKTPLKKLSAQTIKDLWQKFMEIYSHRFIDVLVIGLFGEAQQLNLLNRCLPIQQLQDLLVILYETSGMSKGRLSFKAAELYNSIETSKNATVKK